MKLTTLLLIVGLYLFLSPPPKPALTPAILRRTISR